VFIVEKVLNILQVLTFPISFIRSFC